MKINAIKNVCGMVIAAVVTSCVAAPAFAGGRHGELWVDDFGPGYGSPDPGYGHPRHQDGGRRHGFCDPGEAVEKARHFGLRRAGVERVSRHEILVTGRYHGHRALLVFDRNSRHCRVIGARGL